MYRVERILSADYKNGFKIFKIYNIFPQNTLIKFDERDKK